MPHYDGLVDGDFRYEVDSFPSEPVWWFVVLQAEQRENLIRLGTIPYQLVMSRVAQVHKHCFIRKFGKMQGVK